MSEQISYELIYILSQDGAIFRLMDDCENVPLQVVEESAAEEEQTVNLNAEGEEWVTSDEKIPWTQSKIASYNSSQKLFRCQECECVGFLSIVAEHWLGTHADLRVFQCPHCPYSSAWARCVRMHLARQHNITSGISSDNTDIMNENPALDEVTKYLQRLKAKVDNEPLPPSPTPMEIKTEPHIEVIVSKKYSSELAREELGENSGGSLTEGLAESFNGGLVENINDVLADTSRETVEQAVPTSTKKRYNCKSCSYATDRRDLHTRHENIHREDKPFHCYVCLKQFSRADHVKKHFVRIHKNVTYDVNKIKKESWSSSSSSELYSQITKAAVSDSPVKNDSVKATSGATATIVKKELHISDCLSVDQGQQCQLEECLLSDKSEKVENLSKAKSGEKRYLCCYCPWSGFDSWCLKRHINTHIKPYLCDFCNYKAARAERLSTHLSKVHKKIICPKCSFFADTEVEIVNHQQTHHN